MSNNLNKMSQNILNISINNFNNLCRTCSQSNDLISIHENIYLLEMLATSAQIQIQLNDELPKNICLNCIKELNQLYAFISKCRTIDAAFRQCLTQQKLLNLRKNYIITEHQEIVNFAGDGTSNSSAIEQHPEIEDGSDVCTNSREGFPDNCQFMSLLEPMELNESSDECQIDPLDVSLPEKSRARYKREHILFLMHCKQHNLKEFTEDVVLDYFLEKSKTMKPTSLGCLYSILKTTLSLNNNVDISKYAKLSAFLKREASGYKAIVSKTFTKDQICKFLHEAPDEIYLMMKVVMIMGIAGGCQRDELMRMRIDDIEDKDSVLIVTVSVSKTNRVRTFLITQNESDWLNIYRKYYSFRVTVDTDHKRLFINYKNGKFTNIPVGKNTFGRLPKLIAEYLDLPNPALYSGHCFRRTSVMLYNKRSV